MGFEDLLRANRDYAKTFDDGGFDGITHKGVLLLTCMDSRIDPLRMVGLGVGDAKILRTPSAHLGEDALRGCVLASHLLQVNRIMIVAHTKCALGSSADADIHASILERTQTDTSGLTFAATPNQTQRLEADLARLANHPLINNRCEIAGFIYDVGTGLLNQVATPSV